MPYFTLPALVTLYHKACMSKAVVSLVIIVFDHSNKTAHG